MGFMKAQITGPSYWWEIDTRAEGTICIPEDLVGKENITIESFKDYVGTTDSDDINDWELKFGYGARLSAPGYMDCTEWCVFDSEEEAKDYLVDLYELCPICLGDNWVGSDEEGAGCRECISQLTSEEFQDAMDGVVGDMSPHQIMAIPGVHEIVSEDLNNIILQEAYDKKVTDYITRRGPCGTCKNCLELQKVRVRILACTNPPFSHADDDIVDVWNTELKRLKCLKL